MDEIKAAYRRRAKQMHPDINTGDPAAATRFARLQEAYDMLTDTDGPVAGSDRWAFDHGMTAEDYARGNDPADLVGDIAGNRRGRVSGGASTSMWVAGEDLAHPLKLTKEEMATGISRTIELYSGQKLTVDIEAGAKAGDVVTLPGLGFPGFGGAPPGNLNVIVEILPTPEIGPAGD